ncbi:Hypothetical predicted protein [Olea europaea subsp. europaea]|uniref:Uncharacterized protein n=1 Tax=Olea europaea subsp. europaea TaxID=158383 RepID=A0A8S0RU84_OLEEU|nr:Hypothetical predicted protein [Olea europaea subsp. europaea]
MVRCALECRGGQYVLAMMGVTGRVVAVEFFGHKWVVVGICWASEANTSSGDTQRPRWQDGGFLEVGIGSWW